MSIKDSKIDLDTIPEKFLGKVEPKGSCLIWTAATDKDGYGRVRDGVRVVAAHRYAWEFANPSKTIPDEMCIASNPDVCPTEHVGKGYPTCVNPQHLALYSKRDVLLRSDKTEPGKHHRQLRCIRGHPFTAENTYVYHGERRCRVCQKQRQRINRKSM